MRRLYFIVTLFMLSTFCYSQKLDVNDLIILFGKRTDTTFLINYFTEKGFDHQVRSAASGMYSSIKFSYDPISEIARFHMTEGNVDFISFHTKFETNFSDCVNQLKEKGFILKNKFDGPNEVDSIYEQANNLTVTISAKKATPRWTISIMKTE